ncbi:LamG-like jellyroll fold domain-containing protein [Crossiella sp. CA198]|uniref:LamG-like jellyroll fold domain-containing protein n=1 Tax=Crossiella sp. CA198 TaxID=3455607 RepID=UPI003F8D5CAC
MVIPAVAAPAAPVRDAATETAASNAARVQNQPVKVTAKTTETTEVMANPNGSFTLTEHIKPVRAKRGDTWVPIDLTLRTRADGLVEPAASPVDLRLSGGGTQALATLGRDGREVGLGWEGVLPAPVLDGRTATYREVLPGADLVVRATLTGFSQLLVVKNAEAAKNPKVRRVVFNSHTRNVTLGLANPTGRGNTPVQTGTDLKAVDSDGKLVFSGEASRMWDSTGAGTHADRLTGPGEGGREAAMGVELSGTKLAVVPDAGFLTAAETKFPVYVDPEYWWTGQRNHHVVVQDQWPTERNFDRTDGKLSDLKAGYAYDYEARKWVKSRSYVELKLSDMHGKIIHDAWFNADVIHSGGCAAHRPTQIHVTSGIDPGTTWSAQPRRTGHLGDFTNVNNRQYCPGASGAEIKVTDLVRTGVQERWSNLTFLLQAADEGNEDHWRRFDLNPRLIVNYNTPPNPPAELGMETGLIPCVRGENRPVVFTKTPRLRARLSDQDGGMLDAGFRVLKGTPEQHTWDGNETKIGNVPSGSFAEVRVPPGVITDGEVYTWHLWSGDYEASSWSEMCEFTIDNVKPGPPAVSSGDYPAGQPSGGAGQTGIFHLKANGTNDVEHYLYDFTEQQGGHQPSTRVNADRIGGDAAIRFTPTLERPQWLSVVSVDRAGNVSPIIRYEFTVARHEPAIAGLAAHWRLDGDLADASGKNRPLSAAGALSMTAEGYLGKSASLNGSGEHLRRPAFVDTAKSFSVSAWVKLDKDDRWGTVVSQESHAADRPASSFYLQYADGPDRWAFAMTDDSRPGGPRVESANPPQLDAWTHLVGAYDAANGKLVLYVNGVKQGEAVVQGWNATGDLVVGAAKFGGNTVDHFPGRIDDVKVYDRLLIPAEAATLANQAVLRSHYAMNEASGTTTRDRVTGGTGTLHGGSNWVSDDYTEVRFNGEFGPNGGHITAPRPAIRTDRSYTVMAWVRLDELTEHAQAAVSLGDPNFSPFVLEYRHEEKQWGFLVSCAGDRACGWHALSAPGQARTNTWVHVAGVYDLATGKAHVYLNGDPVGSAENVTGWHGAGAELLIGRAQWERQRTNYWKGSVDDVKIFSGIPTRNELRQLAVRS